MEWANESVSSSFYATALTSLQRYYVFMRVKMHRFSARTIVLLSLMQTLQFVSFIFPPEESRELPWNYAVLKPLWTLISLVFDPLALMEWSGVHSAIAPAIVLGLLLEQLLTSLVLMVRFARRSHYDYIAELGAPRVEAIHFWHFRLHEASNFLLMKALYFPVVYHFVADCTCLAAYTCVDPPSLPPPYVLYVELPALTLLGVRKVADVAFVGNIQWQVNDFESLSTCLYRTVLVWLETIMVCVVSAVSYHSHSGLHGLLLLSLGLLFLNYLYRRMPFHRLRMNQIKIIRGQLFLWSGVTTLVAEGMGGYSQGSFGPTLLYWLSLLVVLPMLTGFFATRAQALSAVKRPDQAFEIEHMIRPAIANEELQAKLDKVLSVALLMFPQSVDLTLWTIYYYILLKDTIFVKVSLAKLMGMKIGVVSLVESFYAVFFVENWLRAIPSEREPLDYMHKRSRLSQIRKHDQEICERLYETFSSIGQVSMRFEVVVANFHRIINDIELCKHNYALTAKIHQSKDVLDSYAGFLDMLQKDEKALSLRYMSSETVKSQVKRRDGKVSLFDSNIMIVMMSLAAQNFGYVTSATRSELLGYMDEQVIGSHHSVLIPPPFNENHDAMLRRITKFRHKHPVYESHHMLYFLDRAQFLVPADWKVCLINRPESGELAVLAAIRPHANFDEVAFLDNSQKHVTVMVFATQTRGFSQFLATFSVSPTDAAVVFRLSEVSDWSGSESVFAKRDVGARQESGTLHQVMADTLMVFGLRKQLLIRLKTGGERVSPLQQSSQPVPSKRLVWGSESSAQTLASIVPIRSEAYSKSSSTSSRNSIHSIHSEKMRRVERLAVWVKVTIGLGLLMMVATVAAFVGFCRAEVEAVGDLFELVGHFQKAEVWTLKAGVVARDLALGGEERTRLRAEEAGAVLKGLSEEARSHLASQKQLWDTADLSDNLWWEYEQRSFVPRRKNLVDTLDSLSSLCYVLSKPGDSLAPLLTLARNAHAETFAYEHENYHYMLNAGKDEIEKTGPIVILLLCTSEAVVLAVVCVLAAAVCCIEQFRRSVWTFVLTMPALTVSLSKSVVLGRLSLDFGQELSGAEQSSYKEKEVRFTYVRSRHEKALYGVLAASLVGSLTFLLISALTFTADLSSLREELMHVEETNIVRITSKLQALIYMKETVLRTRLDPLLSQLATTSPVANSSESWERALQTGYTAERDFCSLPYLTNTAFASNFEWLESAPSTLHLGLHSAADELTMRQRHLLQARLSPQQAEAESLAIDNLYSAMEPALLASMQSVSSAQRDAKAAQYTAAIAALAEFASVVVVLWMAVLYPLLRAVLATQFSQVLKKEWSVVLLFQDDDQGALATRLKHFNSRPAANA